MDGWRGISILAVLAAHLLPLGPRDWQLNLAVGVLGMAVFFCLSGFLITTFLLRHTSTVDFLIRRLCRILPLAWLGLAVGFWWWHVPQANYLPNFLFYANLPPWPLVEGLGHFWSLGVEMQFYGGVALLVTLAGRRALKLLPLACVAITLLRVVNHRYTSIETYYRVDEILSGATLALAFSGEFGDRVRRALSLVNPWILAGLFLLSTHEAARFIDYGRPYFAAALVGASLVRPRFPFASILRGRALAYIAGISYALYIVHPMLANTWLGSGSTAVKYLKRPLLLVAIVSVAHLSTFYYERRWIAFGKRLSARIIPPADVREEAAT